MDTMASVRTSTFSTPKRRAETPDYSTSEYVGRHVLATSPQLPEGVHPRAQGFRILSRLARAIHTAA
jgi:hypothetical protein